jgi:hypothetical protein
MGCVCLKDDSTKQANFDFPDNENFNSSKENKFGNSYGSNNSAYDTTETITKKAKGGFLSTDQTTTRFHNDDETTREQSRVVEKRDFKKDLFDEINYLRTEPEKYVNKIQKFISLIKEEDDPKKPGRKIYFIEKEGMTKGRILLKKGEKSFKDCMVLLHGTQHLPPLIYKPDLEIEVPTIDPTKREKLTELINNKAIQLGGGYSNYGFHFDLNILDHELSCVLQIVDDSNFQGQRHNNLMSHNFKYIGISHSTTNKCEEQYCIYLNFAS